MSLFLILFLIGSIMATLGLGNQLRGEKTPKQIETSSSTTKYVPMDVFDDLVMAKLIHQ